MIGSLQANEVITLVTSVLLAPLVVISAYRLHPRVRVCVLATHAAILVSEIATNVEGFFLGDVLNLLEHLAIAAASVLFALTVLAIRTHGLEDGVA